MSRRSSFRPFSPVTSSSWITSAATGAKRFANSSVRLAPNSSSCQNTRPQAGLFVYWTVALTFGRDASVARSACHLSYSGVPRRGGASDGNPPIACGMSAIGLLPAVVHPESNAAASSRRANLILASRGTLQRTRVLINRLTSGSTTRVMKKKTTPTSEKISAVAIADTPNKKQLDRPVQIGDGMSSHN